MSDPKIEGYITDSDDSISKRLLLQLNQLEEISGLIKDGKEVAFCILAGPLARTKLEADIQIYSEKTNSRILAHYPDITEAFIGKYHVRIVDIGEYIDTVNKITGLKVNNPFDEDNGNLYVFPIREYPYMLRIITEMRKPTTIITELKGQIYT